jgi:hypothetical protein
MFWWGLVREHVKPDTSDALGLNNCGSVDSSSMCGMFITNGPKCVAWFAAVSEDRRFAIFNIRHKGGGLDHP